MGAQRAADQEYDPARAVARNVRGRARHGRARRAHRRRHRAVSERSQGAGCGVRGGLSALIETRPHTRSQVEEEVWNKENTPTGTALKLEDEVTRHTDTQTQRERRETTTCLTCPT